MALQLEREASLKGFSISRLRNPRIRSRTPIQDQHADTYDSYMPVCIYIRRPLGGVLDTC